MHERRTAARLALSAVLLGAACDSPGDPGTSESRGGSSGAMASSAGASGAGAVGGSVDAAGSGGGPGTSGAGASAAGSSAGSGGSVAGGQPSGGSAQGGAAGASGSGGTSADNDCGELVNGAAPVVDTQRSGELPAPQGGTVVDGTYALTARNVYPPAKAESEPRSAVLRLTGGRYELVRSGGFRETGTFAATTIVLKLSAECPNAGTLSKPYTASGATLSLVSVSDDVEEVFTRQ
ncbi:MAG: hypothetical protein EOO73_19415 [Myxococcales bacterium]|nr:MAG: hypothetical protein EOO73_19415 [Myxococcales bacterium]